MKSSVPPIRIRQVNDRDLNPSGELVLYWMIASRRIGWNFALERAVDWAVHLGRPLVILEPLRAGYPWASDRLHRFIIDGMGYHALHLREKPVLYYPYVEARPGQGKGFLRALARKACAVITDDFPAFFIPSMVSAAGTQLSVLLEAVDSNGLLPMKEADRTFPTAFAFRRFLQKKLPHRLLEFPKADPLKGKNLPLMGPLPPEIQRKWPKAPAQLLEGDREGLSLFPIDHSVGPVGQRGGTGTARERLSFFLDQNLPSYAEWAREPEAGVTSGLSPWLHFGHISVHEIFRKLIKVESWSYDRLSEKTAGKRSGWWSMRSGAESFLDQIVTWRELGFNMCCMRDDYARYESLPEWASRTLEAHARDKRPRLYSPEEFESAATHDPLWNAAQNQLRLEGSIHNTLRMLWGKKILEWSATPRQALEVMVHLNDKYGLDGRDPNSYSGIFWVLGRYDRPWGPERAVFGKVRYMSSNRTAKKVSVGNYIRRYEIV